MIRNDSWEMISIINVRQIAARLILTVIVTTRPTFKFVIRIPEPASADRSAVHRHLERPRHHPRDASERDGPRLNVDIA